MDVMKLCEVETCPYCYGQSFCANASFLHLSFTLNYFLSYFSVKNVFYATYNGTRVVIKKLAHTSELRQLKHIEDSKDTEESIIDALTDLDGQNVSPLRVCSREIAVDLVKKFASFKLNDASSDDHLKNLWTITKLNPEPLLLQLLKQEDGWPVPKYFGSCGRLIVESDCGTSLTYASDLKWTERAMIAVQLLELAEKFTDGHLDFRFYLTDVSPDNVAVDSDLKVSFIDLENAIINSKHNGTVHHSYDFIDEDFAFSESDICFSSISDHNYYAVCKLLLSKHAPWPMVQGGLLHSPPDQLLTNELFQYIELCVRPSRDVTRFRAYKRIIVILWNLIHKM